MAREEFISGTAPELLSEADHHDYLVRSRTEIIRILRSIKRGAEPVSTFLGREDAILICHIRDVEEETGAIVFGYGFNREMNEALLVARNISFVCIHHAAKVQFTVPQAFEVLQYQNPSFKTAIPELLWRLQRRQSKRYQVASLSPIRILLNLADIARVEGEIVDISVHGIGMVQYPPDIVLEPGQVLSGCNIVFPMGESVPVDVRIQHSSIVTDRNGRAVRRCGCRFTGTAQDIEKLIEQYVVRLDRDPPPESGSSA